jgi:PAS domain S-box-containing protein
MLFVGGRQDSGMNSSETILFTISTVLYVVTMFFVMRMASDVRDRRPWLVLFAALFALFTFRVLAFFISTQTRQEFGPWLQALVSALLLTSVLYFRRISIAERESKALANRRTAERDEIESRYRALAELCPDVMYVNVGGQISYANAAAVRFFGARSVQDLLGRSPVELAAPESRASVAARPRKLKEIGQSLPAAPEEWLRFDGSRVPVEATAALVPWRGEQGILVILRDVSERKRAEEEKTQLLASERTARSAAERASRMKDEFLATLSHELRTPLTAILGWAHVLSSGRISESDMDQGLETIERNARAQTKLVDDLLDMSSIISGKLRLDMQRLSPVTFIEAAIETIRPTAEARQIRLSRRLDLNAGPLRGDANRMQQVVWNLLSNAVKFTPAGGTVEVILQRVGSQIEIAVADSGMGISADFLPFVFDRFRQADSSIRRKHSGLGIGLAIVKQLVELHGGSVRVESEGDGKGAIFTVTLPLAPSPERTDSEVLLDRPSASGRASNSKTVDLTGLKVLVVDDEPDACRLIKFVLAECHADVVTASSAAEAMPLVEMGRPDILISDIGMPEVDGYELLRRVRALGAARGGKVPAIALTAFARPEDRAHSLKVGFSVHVSKPIQPDKLTATVATLAGRGGSDGQ